VDIVAPIRKDSGDRREAFGLPSSLTVVSAHSAPSKRKLGFGSRARYLMGKHIVAPIRKDSGDRREAHGSPVVVKSLCIGVRASTVGEWSA
jgi:hypothetical protein